MDAFTKQFLVETTRIVLNNIRRTVPSVGEVAYSSQLIRIRRILPVFKLICCVAVCRLFHLKIDDVQVSMH